MGNLKIQHQINTNNKRKTLKRDTSDAIQCYLLLSAQIIGFLVITIYPILWAVRLAWFYYDGVISNTRFVGWENFRTIFVKDITYWKTWLTTIKFSLLKLPLELPFALLIAVLLNKEIKYRGFFRAMYYLPNIIGVAIIGLIFSNMFDYFGIVNAWLEKLNLVNGGIDWFANSGTAMTVLVLGSIWQSFGLNTIYFLAALQNVPKELYESAYIDGASKSTILFKITLPLMAPVIQIILLLSINGTLHVNDYILVMTNGAPRGETFTVMSYLVSKFVPGFAETQVNIGYGCALSIVTSIIMCVIALAYLKFSKKMASIY